MKIEQTKKEDLKHEYSVKFKGDEISKRIEKKLHEVGKNIKMPGFRPGKVPMKVLKDKYGSAVMGEVLETAVNEGTREVIREYEIRPAMQPRIEVKSFDEKDGLEYTMSVELIPDFDVVSLDDIKLEKLKVTPADKNVDETVEKIASNSNSSEVVEDKNYKAKIGDIAVIDFDGTVDGNPFPGMKGEGFSLELGSKSFIDNFEDQLVGSKAGDEKTVTVTFPDDYGQEQLQGVEAVFEVKVKELRKVVPAVVDEEFAKKLGFDSVDKLKEAIKDQLQREHDQLSRMHLKRQLLDVIDKKHEFPVPQGMIDAEFFAIWQQLKGAQHPEDPSHEHGKDCKHDAKDKGTKEENEEFRGLAKRRVKLGLVLAEIGKVRKVEVTDQELQQAVVAEARKYPGQEAQVFEFFQKNPHAVESIRAPLFEEKVVDVILESVDIDEKEVSVEELAEAVNQE